MPDPREVPVRLEITTSLEPDEIRELKELAREDSTLGEYYAKLDDIFRSDPIIWEAYYTAVDDALLHNT